MKKQKYDVIIVGTGVAGLFAGLSLPKTSSVLMITKDELANSDSYLAQGGISTLLGPDDFDAYFEDTMKAGRYENNPKAVEEMLQGAHGVVDDLIANGVEFDKTEDGKLEYTREGGHSKFRILHHQDVTGKEIVEKLLIAAQNRENITLLEYTTMLDLIEEENSCYGIVATHGDEIQNYYGKAVVLATGGLGGLFRSSTNFSHITGDSFSLAIRHQIEIEHINYIQIHPTVLYSKTEGRRFLISEAVRGEGGILLNEEGKRFTDELQPRDVVADAIRKEMEKFGTDHVYLSMAQIPPEKVIKHFPNIYQRCLEEGYDVLKEPIPVTPAQHYLMGGIKTNTNGETSMEGLYAAGETACNGVHGANRLASNSLLESLVFARNVARCLSEKGEQSNGLYVSVNESLYGDVPAWERENKQLLLSEIKRKDLDFYDKWCSL
ncbi:MAG: L-aspartate oxidase [Anaerovorax sp.]